MEKIALKISGMSCGHCVAAVTRSLADLKGVEIESVAIGSAVVGYDVDTVTPEQISQAVEDAGYGAMPVSPRPGVGA